jgi:nitrate reductase NapE component
MVMHGLDNYLVAGVVALVLGGSVVAVLFRPLFGAVKDLCGTRERALFWSVYLSTILILVPLLGVAFIGTYGGPTVDFVSFVQRAVFFALLGLTAALVTIGFGIWRPSNNVEPGRANGMPAAPRDKILS